MFQKPKEPEINVADPFADDQLQRRLHAENLKNFIQNSPDNFVMSVNSPWGTGKTFFLTRLAQLLKNEQHLVLYFNAWESDFAPHPLTAFISEIQELWKEEKIIEKKTFEKIRKNGMQILKNFAPTAIQLATLNILNADAVKEIVELAKGSDKAVADTLARQANKQPDEYKKTKDAIKSFKTELKKLVESAKQKGKKTPVVIIIDELDRCRPNYAVELLETVKHIFDVPNVVFMLGTDRKQLGHSVRTLYGADMDSDNYLRRFIDIEYQLPNPPTSNIFSSYLIQRFKIDEILNERNLTMHLDVILKTFSKLTRILSVSPRTQKQAIARLKVILQVTSAQSLSNFWFHNLIFLLILHEIKPDLYKKLTNKRITYEDFMNELPSSNEMKAFFISDGGGGVIDGFLHLHFHTQEELDLKYKTEMQGINSSSLEIGLREKWGLIKHLNQFSGRRTNHLKSYQAIELSEEFIIQPS